MPHVMYRVHGQDVSFFVLPGTARKADDLVTLGHRSQIWSRDGTTFVLVSAADAGGHGERVPIRDERSTVDCPEEPQ